MRRGSPFQRGGEIARRREIVSVCSCSRTQLGLEGERLGRRLPGLFRIHSSLIGLMLCRCDQS